MGQRSEAKETSEASCGERYAYQPIKRLSVLCRLWQENDFETHYSKKDGSVQYFYRCGGYASRVNSCTSHTISADNVEALILLAVKRFSKFVLNDEKAFALELQSLWKGKQEEKPKHNQSELTDGSFSFSASIQEVIKLRV